MKNIIKVLIVFLLVFIILIIGKLFIDKFGKEEKINYKIENDTYFSNNDIEIVLYKDNTYFMYKSNETTTGTYKLEDNQVTFTTLKKYGDYCYDNVTNSFIGILKGKKNIESISIDNIDVNIIEEITDKVNYINDKEDCSIRKTFSTSDKDYGISEKYEHDIVINNKKINYKSNVEDKEDLNKFLIEFFDRYFNIMETLEYKDISDMFENKENAYIYKTALDLLIENRKRNEYDLSISNSKYELTIQDYSKNGDEVTFKAVENCSYNFNFIKQYTTSVYNIKNEFTLIKKDGEYKIKSYNKVQDFYVMITGVYNSSSDYKTALDKVKNNYLAKFDTMNEKFKKMKNDYLNNNYQIKQCDHQIDRKASYEYATKWVGRRNDAKWESHGGANCVNFASQVMNAGGLPMDENGKFTWYNYNKGSKETFSWINVGGIVNYFKNNTGSGLCGKYDENIYLGEPGDVITVGYVGDLKHATSVISQIKDKNGKVIDLLVSSNTVDLINYPVSAYAYPYKTLLKVYGYNN